MPRHIVDIITMGCSKNLVDSEHLMAMFKSAGIDVFHNPDELHGDIAVVNTCGFIGDAKEESIEMILSLCEKKAQDLINQVYVMGCLSGRYRNELMEEIPEVDKFYGKFDWKQLLSDLNMESGSDSVEARAVTTPSHYAYVKIAEGCNRKCAYCAIPIITGKHVSRPMEDILREVEGLVHKGVREFQIIAQELTFYGVDLYGKQCIAELVDRMAKIEGVEWIRLQYAYPNNFPVDLLEVIRRNQNVCKYLDIALQHISDHVLSNMLRHTTKEETISLIKKIREDVPEITLRTTLMVGFPGETQADFDELIDFVKWAKFDRMGAFAYSEEEGTYAAINYEDDVPEDVKQSRLDRVMKVQEGIMTELNSQKEGKVFKTIIDRREGDYYVGRTEADSPEVDCEVLIPHSEGALNIGDFYQVEIVSADTFDLYGTVVEQSA